MIRLCIPYHLSTGQVLPTPPVQARNRAGWLRRRPIKWQSPAIPRFTLRHASLVLVGPLLRWISKISNMQDLCLPLPHLIVLLRLSPHTTIPLRTVNHLAYPEVTGTLIYYQHPRSTLFRWSMVRDHTNVTSYSFYLYLCSYYHLKWSCCLYSNTMYLIWAVIAMDLKDILKVTSAIRLLYDWSAAFSFSRVLTNSSLGRSTLRVTKSSSRNIMPSSGLGLGMI